MKQDKQIEKLVEDYYTRSPKYRTKDNFRTALLKAKQIGVEENEVNIKISWDISDEGWCVMIMQEVDGVWHAIQKIDQDSESEGVITFSNSLTQHK